MRRDRSEAASTRVRSRVLFAEERGGVFIVDCVLCEDAQLPGRFLSAGTPFALELSLPEVGWAEAAVITVQRWVRDCCAVAIELRRIRGRMQLQLSDGQSTARLDVLATPGL